MSVALVNLYTKFCKIASKYNFWKKRKKKNLHEIAIIAMRTDSCSVEARRAIVTLFAAGIYSICNFLTSLSSSFATVYSWYKFACRLKGYAIRKHIKHVEIIYIEPIYIECRCNKIVGSHVCVCVWMYFLFLWFVCFIIYAWFLWTPMFWAACRLPLSWGRVVHSVSSVEMMI